MSLFSAFLLAVALAMDSFAVSICSGTVIGNPQKIRNAILIASTFALTQALLLFTGWGTGYLASESVKDYDHWLVFGILSAIGGKMIWDSLSAQPGETKCCCNPMQLYVLLTLAIATSMDAAAAGLGVAFVKVSIVDLVLLTGGVTFVLSFAGTYLGNRLGSLFGRRAECAGGLLLIFIGTRILLEHLAGNI